jgi:hypothetical protein
MPKDLPDPDHRTPEGVDDLTIEALGALSDALETVERVRGHLYSMHQLTGAADLKLDRAIDLFRRSGHPELADRLETEIVGRNVIAGRWTFQIVEDYDDGYWGPFRELDREAREQLVGGRRHLFEARMKQERRTAGLAGHEATPADVED